MAAAWTSLGLAAVAVVVVGIAMPASASAAAPAQPPAPAPSSDGENSLGSFNPPPVPHLCMWLARGPHAIIRFSSTKEKKII
ncbi:Os06g0505700 [Oryza sativa Japonica Group]|jgi:hypothetical protein|uniref:Os06g0505700 protein n=1 Tax=Oryza sativa subsp. japonica TaxID=39947 RepID=Q0DBZ2_ORYSJ|nr:Os06g0505700 [Oryza sativa Japonica Group]|eukprot:NP_001057717.1 Os06g0505700 [Oryza sativa Japonica Group]